MLTRCSGLAAGSPPAPTVLTSEGANQQVTGTCQDLAGNVASATVSGINIDKTPPVHLRACPPQADLCRPDQQIGQVATISSFRRAIRVVSLRRDRDQQPSLRWI